MLRFGICIIIWQTVIKDDIYCRLQFNVSQTVFLQSCNNPSYSPSNTHYCKELDSIIWHYTKASKQHHNESRTRSSMEITTERLYFHEYAFASVKWAVKWDSISYTQCLKKVLKCLKGTLKESKKPISFSGGNLGSLHWLLEDIRGIWFSNGIMNTVCG